MMPPPPRRSTGCDSSLAAPAHALDHVAFDDPGFGGTRKPLGGLPVLRCAVSPLQVGSHILEPPRGQECMVRCGTALVWG